MTRPRLLFLCQTLPYPPDGGVKIRSFHTLRTLSEDYEIDALCFVRSRAGLDAGHLDALSRLGPYAQTEAFEIPGARHRVRFGLDHLRSLMSGRTYTDFVYDSAGYRQALQERLAGAHYAIVHLDTMDLGGFLPLLAGRLVACTHHNVESLLLADRARHVRNPIVAAYLQLQSRLMRHAEEERCPQVALNITVSEADASALRAIAPAARVAVVPNGVDTSYFTPGQLGRNADLVFVGGTTWFPNRDALQYFAAEILPGIRRRVPGVTVKWVGRSTEAERRHYADVHGIELTGYVEDIRPHVLSSAVYVAPIRSGGGTRLKILDAWAMGMPMVATTTGVMGLEARDGGNVLVRDTPDDFASGVAELLTDADARARLDAAARDTVERRYGWEVVGRSLRSLYHELIAGAAPAEGQGPQVG